MNKRFSAVLLSLGLLVGTPPLSGEYPTSEDTKHILDLNQAQEVFNRMATLPDIAWNYVDEGCYARCHLMVDVLVEERNQCGQVWAFANGELLHVRTPHHYVQWKYHVAPTVRVRTNAGEYDLVLDPALFRAPVTVQRWLSVMQRRKSTSHPWVCQTVPDQPPMLPSGKRAKGSGYWPGANPAAGPHEHACITMNRFLGRYYCGTGGGATTEEDGPTQLAGYAPLEPSSAPPVP
jgi:glutaminase-like protein